MVESEKKWVHCGGSLSMITRRWNLSLQEMRSVVTLPKLQILDRSWLENSFSCVPIRAWRIPKPTAMWHGFIWAQRQDPALHYTVGMNKASVSDYTSWYCPETICSSFEAFSGYAAVSAPLKPAAIEWKGTELPPGMEDVFSTLVSQELFCIFSTVFNYLL